MAVSDTFLVLVGTSTTSSTSLSIKDSSIVVPELCRRPTGSCCRECRMLNFFRNAESHRGDLYFTAPNFGTPPGQAFLAKHDCFFVHE